MKVCLRDIQREAIRLGSNVGTFLVEFEKEIEEFCDQEIYVLLLASLSNEKLREKDSFERLVWLNEQVEQQLAAFREYDLSSEEYKQCYSLEDVRESVLDSVDSALCEAYNWFK